MRRWLERGDKTTGRIRGTTEEIALAARRLRGIMTPAEQVLWDALPERRLKRLRFRKQHPVGPVVLDFYCSSCKLVVEVDGAVHEQQAEYDQARTEQLNAYGYTVVRFRNEEVFTALPSVLERILAAAAEAREASSPVASQGDSVLKSVGRCRSSQR
jgi:very-short-patch-repair endonuclease